MFKFLARIYGSLAVEIRSYLVAILNSFSTWQTLLSYAANEKDVGIRLDFVP